MKMKLEPLGRRAYLPPCILVADLAWQENFCTSGQIDRLTTADDSTEWSDLY